MGCDYVTLFIFLEKTKQKIVTTLESQAYKVVRCDRHTSYD